MEKQNPGISAAKSILLTVFVFCLFTSCRPSEISTKIEVGHGLNAIH